MGNREWGTGNRIKALPIIHYLLPITHYPLPTTHSLKNEHTRENRKICSKSNQSIYRAYEEEL
jgi:hypothetical protein